MGGWSSPERDKVIFDGALQAKVLSADNGVTQTVVITTATLTHTLTFVKGILVAYNESGG